MFEKTPMVAFMHQGLLAFTELISSEFDLSALGHEGKIEKVFKFNLIFRKENHFFSHTNSTTS